MSPSSSTTHDRRSERSRRVAAERAAQASRERRQRKTIITGVVAAVLAVAVGLGIAIQSSRNSTDTTAPVPAGTEGGSLVVGSEGAPVTVTVYEDFQCPACAQAESALGSTLDALLDDGSIRLDHRPIAILDRASADRYSTRALNAAACVIDTSPESYPAFRSALFAAQPGEGGSGLTSTQLTDLANEAGASDAGSCIDDLRFDAWTKAVTDKSSKDGITQTPTILVDGRALTERTPEALRALVDAAR